MESYIKKKKKKKKKEDGWIERETEIHGTQSFISKLRRAFVPRLNALSDVLFDPGLSALSLPRRLRHRVSVLFREMHGGKPPRDEPRKLMLTGFNNKSRHSLFPISFVVRVSVLRGGWNTSKIVALSCNLKKREISCQSLIIEHACEDNLQFCRMNSSDLSIENNFIIIKIDKLPVRFKD